MKTSKSPTTHARKPTPAHFRRRLGKFQRIETDQDERACMDQLIAASARLNGEAESAAPPAAIGLLELGSASKPAPASETMRARYVGMLGGIPLPTETLALLAMKEVYLTRSCIINNVILKHAPDQIVAATELTRALLVIEQVLHHAGVDTDRSVLAAAKLDHRYSELEMLMDCLESTAGLVTDSAHTEMMQRVNQVFRPWIKPTHKAAALR